MSDHRTDLVPCIIHARGLVAVVGQARAPARFWDRDRWGIDPGTTVLRMRARLESWNGRVVRLFLSAANALTCNVRTCRQQSARALPRFSQVSDIAV